MRKKKTDNLKHRLSLVLRLMLFFGCLFQLSGLAMQEKLPPGIQAVMCKKIFGYTKSLSGGVRIAVVYDDSNEAEKDQIVAEFEKLALDVYAVRADKVTSLAGSTVAFLLSTNLSVRRYCRANSILTFSTNGAMVTQADAAIGVIVDAGKPKVIINTDELKAVGHTLSSDLLKLAILVTNK